MKIKKNTTRFRLLSFIMTSPFASVMAINSVIAYSNVGTVLHALVKEGKLLVERRACPCCQRKQSVYQLTPATREALEERKRELMDELTRQ